MGRLLQAPSLQTSSVHARPSSQSSLPEQQSGTGALSHWLSVHVPTRQMEVDWQSASSLQHLMSFDSGALDGALAAIGDHIGPGPAMPGQQRSSAELYGAMLYPDEPRMRPQAGSSFDRDVDALFK